MTAIPEFLKKLLLMIMVLTPALLVRATSVKMDFLSADLVRTDPFMYSEIGECLSDHVHRFYGAVSNKRCVTEHLSAKGRMGMAVRGIFLPSTWTE